MRRPWKGWEPLFYRGLACPIPMPPSLYEGTKSSLNCCMPAADSDPKPGTVSGSSASTELEAAQERAGAPAAPRPLLSELAARLASALKGFRQDSTIRESLEEVIEESDRETKE